MKFKKGRSWNFENLPDLPSINWEIAEKRPFTPPENKVYGFYIGKSPTNKTGKYSLNISEIPNRSAEGRPMYLEQEAWVRLMLKKKGIRAKEIWFSNWEFKTTEDALKFINLLDEIAASSSSKC